MDCFLDHELDSATRREVDMHLADCAACRSAFDQQRALRSALGEKSQYYRAPPSLSANIKLALDKIDASSNTNRRQLPGWLSLAASIAIAALLGSGTTYWLMGTSQKELLAQEIIAGHVRAQMVAGRLTDIASSDSHTVKPWFNGKLDFAPPVLDLTSQGFPLVGGRLDYLANHPVAALVYRHRQHLIHLFIWPTMDRTNNTRNSLTRQGFQLYYWSDHAMQYWAVSDLNADALKTFSEHIQEQATMGLMAPSTGGLPASKDLG